MEELLRLHGGNGAVSDDAKRQFRDGLWDMVAPGPAGSAARRVVGADRCFQLRCDLVSRLVERALGVA